MTMQYTDRLYNGTPGGAENDLFSWFWGQDGYLVEKATGRAIYQMAYMLVDRFGSEDITDTDTIAAVREFWGALRSEQKRAEAEYKQKSMSYVDCSRKNDERKAVIYDNLQNEGYTDGYNPYRNNGGLA